MNLNEYNDYPLANSQPDELNSFGGNPSAVEHRQFSGNDSAHNGEVRRGKSKVVTVVVTSLAAIIALITLLTAQPATLNAEFVGDLQATDTAVTYTVKADVDETTDLSSLFVVLRNAFTDRKQPFDEIEKDADGNFTGSFQDLKPNREYTVAVVQKTALGQSTVITKPIRTTDNDG